MTIRYPQLGVISIHALRVEGDDIIMDEIQNATISIHALRVEGDCGADKVVPGVAVFLSTPSGWRATRRSPHDNPTRHPISIHALRVEGDAFFLNGFPHVAVFLSTPSGWRATYNGPFSYGATLISIHALRVEGDARTTRATLGRR